MILLALQQVFLRPKCLFEMDTRVTYHTKDFSFQIGVCVLLRNYRRRFKFGPYFLPNKFCVIDILANGNTLLIENTVSDLCLQRHPNDIKLLNGSLPSLPEQAVKNDNIVYDESLH